MSTICPDEQSRLHMLLHRALIVLHDELEAMVECGCSMSMEHTPIPGTCEPDMVPLIENHARLVRDIEAEIGPSPRPIQPWMDTLLQSRWSLTTPEET
uniref:hypothetical protein n=1 Tax=Pannonibacter phragmitetus TaxID=121719 RepID=UPI000B96CA55|nr:hypothetical protein [Pannonibacter phragmitetus]